MITGAGGRIGSATARALFNEGAKLILCDVSERNLSIISNELALIDGSRITYHISDFTNSKSIYDLLDFYSSQNQKIDAAVHAAYPTSSGWGNSIENLEFQNLFDDLTSQLGGAIIFSKIIMEFFVKQGEGNLVHISSIQGLSAPKFDHYEGTLMTSPIEYTAIKSGIIAITKWLAKYYKNKNIRVNCVSPGGIYDNQDTKFVKNYRQSCCNKGLLNAEDVASAIVFLILKNSYCINGQNLVIDDGWSL